ncbi:helix-turn-helix domain-containing protein [Agriterribacter sp.]|uniref:helix-turn-helix domain-containing protein n=1 Tax=Agriterribacter sp. TaxID=2821509 RepID=UPI002CB0A2C9|nr:helix-turn-helix domain-containing protein [Agriterribacter sp.]HRO45129.1 helix-turn-helix domain-containing protein [Agriterribacter sp.]HRQ15430.1 helix-turn-helix domain-containing protein [Agriterribacter sp.]
MDQIILSSFPLKDLETVIIDCVNNCLKNSKHYQPTPPDLLAPDQDEILNIKEASAYLKLAVPTLYKFCGEKTIPYIKKGGKLLFYKKELLKWAEEGRQKTKREIRLDAETWLGKLGQKKAINNK